MPQALQLKSLITEAGELELALHEVDVRDPGPDEVLIKVEGTPINPSDLGGLIGMADVSTARISGTTDRPVIKADVPQKFMAAMAPRVGKALQVGNEGAGEVVAAGDNADAQALLGRTVAVLGGAMYAQYRIARTDQCLVLNEGTSARDGASCFVNPLTALGMVETMRLEGHSALVHTAAASNLGQMLVKICVEDDVGLVNIVRKAEHVAILKDLGARHVVNSSDDTYLQDLTNAIDETGATLGFDAIGGGRATSQILACMEMALSSGSGSGGPYGSTTHKQVYIYGGLDREPTTLQRSYGMAWGIGGWLLPPFLSRIGFDAAEKLRRRVADEIQTTFASSYTAEVSLVEMLTVDAVQTFAKQATGEKYLVNPNKG